ncbi:alcohol acetyltransferase [Irpex lacteus]|nr:alcohol acetyltransferase [Irpex lacteus]
MSAPPKDNKLREVGLLEKFHLIRVNGEFDTCVLSAAKYTFSPSPSNPHGRLTRPIVLRALRHLILTHASLSAYATSPPPPFPSTSSDTKKTETKHNPYELVFRRLPTVDLDHLVTFDAYPGKTLQEVIKAELETPLPNGKTVVEGSETRGEGLKPLWRVSVLEDEQTVVFAWHHAIGDGSSGFALHRSFLDALNSSSSSGGGEAEEELIVTPPQDLTMVQPTEALTSVAVSWRTFFLALYETFAPKSWLKGYTAWTGNLVGSPPTPSSSSSPSPSDEDNVKFGAAKTVRVHIQTIPTSSGKALVALCRANGTTLTAFLHTLAVSALSETLHAHGGVGERWKTFSTSIPVSLRRFTGASGYDMCDHVSNFHFYPPISPPSSQPVLELSNQTFPWPTAQRLSTHLRTPALLAGTKETIGTIRYLFDLGIAGGFFSGQMGKKRGYSFEVSNLGVLSQNESKVDSGKDGEAEWDVEDVYFAQNDGTCGAAIKINVAGVSSSGTISVVYTWGEGAVDESVAEGFVERMERGVEMVLG